MKINLSFLAILLCAAANAFSQTTTTVTISNGATTLLQDFSGNPLPQGAGATNSDGSLIQLGYYQSGSTAANFGTVGGTDWVSLTSASPSVGPNTTIGDTFNKAAGGAGAGTLSFTQIIFVVEDGTSVDVYDPGDSGHYITLSMVNPSTVPANQVLAIRFFDTTTGTSGRYNAVSADNWLWKTPDSTGTLTVPINLTTSTLEFLDPLNAFKTSLLVVAVPEPSTYASTLLSLGAMAFVGIRRRLKK
jgi:hypothetical protein